MGISWDFLGTLTINNGDFMGFHGIFMGFHRWYVTNHVCFCVSAGDSAARLAASHGTKLSGVYPIVTRTKYHIVDYIYIILIYYIHIYIYIYITYITYISTIYILHNIYIYIPSYKSPFLLVSGLSISVPNIFSAFRVFACASAQRAVKAACIGSENASAKCFPRPPCSVQQIV